MKRIGHYLRHHKFVHWLALVVISFAIYAGGQALIGRPDWLWVVGMSLICPTVMLLFDLIKNDSH